MKKIDIVIPCYNESKCVELTYSALKALFTKELSAYEWSVLYIDDGGQDDTLERIVKLSNMKNSNVRFISFARNFGKELAIYAVLKMLMAIMQLLWMQIFSIPLNISMP